MRFARIELTNWKNFKAASVALGGRVFLVGPAASGKSNFLDAFRFLKDLASDGGGLGKAIDQRDGMPRVRTLYARKNVEVGIRVEVHTDNHDGWTYQIGLRPVSQRDSRPVIASERVQRVADGSAAEVLLDRPDEKDRGDPERLFQSSIQQVAENRRFRELVEFFRSISYLHLVPQLVREQQSPRANGIGLDPFGRDLLDRIRNTPTSTRRGRLSRIQKVLKIVAPQMKDLELWIDEHGRPHLRVRFEHWRPHGAYQNESQFSDGTLRLIGLLWSLQEPAGPLLLEEPELSLHPAIVRRLAPFIHRAQTAGQGRQVILSTHSTELLTDPGIPPDEVLLVQPASEGSRITEGASVPEIVRLMRAGIPASEAILPRTEPGQLHLFDKAKA